MQTSQQKYPEEVEWQIAQLLCENPFVESRRIAYVDSVDGAMVINTGDKFVIVTKTNAAYCVLPVMFRGQRNCCWLCNSKNKPQENTFFVWSKYLVVIATHMHFITHVIRYELDFGSDEYKISAIRPTVLNCNSCPAKPLTLTADGKILAIENGGESIVFVNIATMSF